MSEIDPREGIIIPTGYKEFSGHVGEYSDSNPENPLRLSMRKRLFFVFNPEDIEFKKFLEQCRIDTKALTKALHDVFMTRNMPIWVKRGKRPHNKSQYRRMGFLIRPPFFHSGEVDKENHRLQQGNDEDIFALHFDEAHNWQSARCWKASAEGEDYTAMLRALDVFARRACITGALDEVGPFLQENYGDWAKMAAKIADAIQEQRTKGYLPY